jgi:hypothetical protein
MYGGKRGDAAQRTTGVAPGSLGSRELLGEVQASRLRASALTLRFGELWKSVESELNASKAAAPVRPLRFDRLLHLSDELAARCLGFLDPRALARLSISCRSLSRLMRRREHQVALWQPHCRALASKMGVDASGGGGIGGGGDSGGGQDDSDACAQPCPPWKRRLVKLHLLGAQAELRHFTTLSRLLLALCRMPKGSVVGLIGNIGCFESLAISLAVSVHSQMSMGTVVLNRTLDAVTFRNQKDYVGPVTFLSLDNISSLLLHDDPALDMPAILAPGFIGYAVNLIKLDQAHEHIRFTFLLSAYKNLSVWASTAQERRARLDGLLPAHVQSVAIDAFATDRGLWYMQGQIGGFEAPCYVAVAKTRPRLHTELALTEHLHRLRAAVDRCRDSLAHCDA